MSRLDDELKVAFQRQEPSPDFAARVLARINEAPAVQAKPSLWQRLSGMLAAPAWRYAAVGAMAVLLILIGIALLRASRTATVGNDSSPQAISPGKTAGETQNADTQASNGAAQGTIAGSGAGQRVPDRNAQANPPGARAEAATKPHAVKSYRAVRHFAPVIARQSPPSAEAEAAKEKVLFALQITSEALNDVQRAISDERAPAEKPEPVHNR